MGYFYFSGVPEAPLILTLQQPMHYLQHFVIPEHLILGRLKFVNLIILLTHPFWTIALLTAEILQYEALIFWETLMPAPSTGIPAQPEASR